MWTSIAAVQEVLQALDGAIAGFQEATDLACVPGCGACCLSPEVETSVAELLPLAMALHRAGTADLWLARADAAGRVGPCVAYAAESPDGKQGRCTVYLLRPGICRLFGFAARLHRHGTPELTTCAVIERESPDKVLAAREWVRAGGSAPRWSEWASRLAAADPDAARVMPINEALARALERVGLWLTLTGAEATAPTQDGPGWSPPEKPVAA